MDVIKVTKQDLRQVEALLKADLAHANKAFIITDDLPVYAFFDNLQIDGDVIYRIRASREIDFVYPCELVEKTSNEVILSPQSLSELVQFLPEPTCPHLRLIIHSTDKEFLASVLRQLLYLDIDIDIMLACEEQKLRAIEGISISLPQIIRILKDTSDEVSNSPCDITLRQSLMDVIEQLQSLFKKLLQQDITIAVMALKKSGKSAFVNCLLDDEYSPTSIELPTVATCIYKKSKDSIISLSYKDTLRFFKTPLELKRYLSSEFKTAFLHSPQSPSHEVIEIHYTSKSDYNYTIIDTPGPDLARTPHKDMAYRWIKEADVVVFIIDYTKHLTDAEEEFFKALKSVFEQYDKFYSFIVVVNKLDMMYQSEEKKSAIRFIDYICERLKALGYRGFVVFAISALQYLNCLIAPKFSECDCLLETEPLVFSNCLQNCLMRYQGKDEITVLSYIDTQIRNLKWFHSKDTATLKDIIAKSAVPKLISYINYVCLQKAHIEAFHHKLFTISQKIQDFHTVFIEGSLSNAYRCIDTLKKKQKDCEEFFANALQALQSLAQIDDQKTAFRQNIAMAQKSITSNITMKIEQLLKDTSKLLKSLNKSQIVSFIKAEGNTELEKLNLSIEQEVVQKNYLPATTKYMNDFNNQITAIEKRLTDIVTAINLKINELQSVINTPLTQVQLQVNLPRLTPEFTKLSLPPIEIKYNPVFAHSLVKERLTRKRGFVGLVLYLLTFGRLNIKTGNFCFDEVKVKKSLFILKKALTDDTAKQLNAIHDTLEQKVDASYNQTAKALQEIISKLSSDITGLLQDFTRECDKLNEHHTCSINTIKSVEMRLQKIKEIFKNA